MALFKKLLLVCCLLFSWQASAAEIDFSGFATIAGGLTMDEDEELLGYNDNFSFDNGSLIALQASSDLGNGWGVTTQLLARGSEGWDVNAEWAYVSYDASDNWRLLFGRQRAPFYMYSDFLDVSYAYHWITPPTGVYSLPFDVFDGIGSIYTGSLGSFDTTFQLAYGRNSDRAFIFTEEIDTDFADIFSASWTMNKDWFTLRASYAQADLTIPFAGIVPLTDGWRNPAFAPLGDFTGIADELEIVEDTGTFASVGFTIDLDTILIVGEVTQIDPSDNFFPEQDSYYISFGKRIGDVLLHFTYGEDEDVSDFSIFSNASNVPTGISTDFDNLLLQSQGLLTSVEEDSTSYTLGLRWDVSSSVAAKFEFTKFDDEHPIVGAEASLFQFALTTVF